MGAHPTACYPFYAYDRPHTALYYEAAKAGPESFRETYLDPYVFSCPDQNTYIDRIGGAATREKLASWKDGNEAWMKLYQEAPM